MPGEVKTLRLLEPVLPVDKLTERNRRRTIGHEFTVSIQLSDIRNCVLQWWEKTDQPYVEGMPPGVWCDMFELHPRSEVFAPWNFNASVVPVGHVEFELRDPPGIMADETSERVLLFDIRIQEINQYTENKQRRIRAKQVLRCTPTVHQFIIFENDVESPDFGPPVWNS